MKPSVVVMDKLDPACRMPLGLQMMFDADKLVVGAVVGDKMPSKYAGTKAFLVGDESVEICVPGLSVVFGPDNKETAAMIRESPSPFVVACGRGKSSSMMGKAVKSRKASAKYHQLGDGDSVVGFCVVDGKIVSMVASDDEASVQQEAPVEQPVEALVEPPVEQPPAAVEAVQASPEQPPATGDEG